MSSRTYRPRSFTSVCLASPLGGVSAFGVLERHDGGRAVSLAMGGRNFETGEPLEVARQQVRPLPTAPRHRNGLCGSEPAPRKHGQRLAEARRQCLGRPFDKRLSKAPHRQLALAMGKQREPSWPRYFGFDAYSKSCRVPRGCDAPVRRNCDHNFLAISGCCDRRQPPRRSRKQRLQLSPSKMKNENGTAGPTDRLNHQHIERVMQQAGISV